MECLLDRGAGIETRDEDGNTALLVSAAFHSHSEVVCSLLDRGADMEAREETYGKTALILAAFKGHR